MELATVTPLRSIDLVSVIDDPSLPLAPNGGCSSARVEADGMLVGWVGDEIVHTGARHGRRWWSAHRLAGDTAVRWRIEGYRTRKAAVEALLERACGQGLPR